MISIIIPVYNTEKFLERCVNSVLIQFSESDGEIILVNDGSTDNSDEICCRFAQNYSFIRYIKQANKGLSSARNAGLEQATQTYIFFIDSDDWLKEGTIPTLKRCLQNNPVDILTFGAFKVLAEKEILLNMKAFRTKDSLQALEFTLTHNASDVYAWNKLIHRELFTHLRFPEGKIYEDMYLTPKLFLKAKSFEFISYYGYAYVINQSSITFSKINHKQFSNIWHRLDLLKTVKQQPNVKASLIDEVHSVVLNGFISTGFKTLDSSDHRKKQYFYRKLKKIIITYGKKHPLSFCKIRVLPQVLALFLLMLFPSLFLFLYKKVKK
ncbi:glycosyltransferase family 2 protein [Glaesserella parasuis]|nr:glycosyltransferase family 2 protein [Glaesserella parasuis]